MDVQGSITQLNYKMVEYEIEVSGTLAKQTAAPSLARSEDGSRSEFQRLDADGDGALTYAEFSR